MLRKSLKNQRGETLVIVMIITVLLLVVGVAAMVFASSNLTASDRQAENKENYYVAKSVLATVNKSITEGETGKYIRNKVLADFIQSSTTYKNKTDWELSPDIQIDSEELDGFEVKNVKITFASRCYAKQGSGSSLQTAQIEISDMKLSFSVTDVRDDSYNIQADYSYQGWVSKENGAYVWSNETWTTEKLEQ